MALARTNLLGQISASGVGSGGFTTSSFTPPSNSLLVVAVAGMGGSGVAVTGTSLTCSGGGWTYTSRVAVDNAATTFDIGINIFTAPVTAGVSMTLTVSHGASNMQFLAVSAVAYTGYDTSTPTGATGTFINPAPTGGDTITLSAGPALDSEVFAAVVMDKESIGCTPGAAFTEVHDLQVADSGGLESQIRSGSTSTSVDWVDTHTGTGIIFKHSMAAVEIKATAAGPPPTPPLFVRPLTSGRRWR